MERNISASSETRKPYGAMKRTAAFLRGIKKFQPLVEVAREGLAGGYSLPEEQQRRYADRIVIKGTLEDMFSVLRTEQPAKVQDLMTFGTLREFNTRVQAQSGIIDELISLAVSKGVSATELRVLHEETAAIKLMSKKARNILVLGTVTDETSIETLTTIRDFECRAIGGGLLLHLRNKEGPAPATCCPATAGARKTG